MNRCSALVFLLLAGVVAPSPPGGYETPDDPIPTAPPPPPYPEPTDPPPPPPTEPPPPPPTEPPPPPPTEPPPPPPTEPPPPPTTEAPPPETTQSQDDDVDPPAPGPYGASDDELPPPPPPEPPMPEPPMPCGDGEMDIPTLGCMPEPEGLVDEVMSETVAIEMPPADEGEYKGRRRVKHIKRKFALKRPNLGDLNLRFIKQCRDRHSLCNWWKMAGECELNENMRNPDPRVHLKFCPRSCDMCTPNRLEWRLRVNNARVLRRVLRNH